MHGVDRARLLLALVAALTGCAAGACAARDRVAGLRGRALSQEELRGLDLRGADLTGVELWSVRLVGADLSGARLSGAAFHNVDLTGAVLRDADLTDARFDSWTDRSAGEVPSGRSSGLVLDRADLRGAQVSLLRSFEVSSAEGARLAGLDFSYLALDRAVLARADLTRAKLRAASCVECDLSEARLDGADLSHALLAYARLRGSRLTGADLRGADLRMADLRGAQLTAARLDGARLQNAGYDATTQLPEGFDAAAHGMQRLNAKTPLCPPEGVRIVAAYERPPCAPVMSMRVAGELLLLGGSDCVATVDRRDPRKLRTLHQQETLSDVTSLLSVGRTLIVGSGYRSHHKGMRHASGGLDVFDLDPKGGKLVPRMQLDLDQPVHVLGAHGAVLALAADEALLLADLSNPSLTPKDLREVAQHTDDVQLVRSGDGHVFYVPGQDWREFDAPLVHLDLTGVDARVSLLALDALAPAAPPIAGESAAFMRFEHRAVPLELSDPAAPKRRPELAWHGGPGTWLAGRVYTGGEGLLSLDPVSGDWNEEAGRDSDLCSPIGQAIDACRIEPQRRANAAWNVGALAADDRHLYLWAHLEREHTSGKLLVLEPCATADTMDPVTPR